MSKNFFSRKYNKILIYNELVKIQNENSNGINNKLIINTSNGLYFGELKQTNPTNDTEIKKGDDFLTLANKMYLSLLEKYDKSLDAKVNEEVAENPITIELEDVTLITSGKTIKMPFVSIFVDKIIGVSIGSVEPLTDSIS